MKRNRSTRYEDHVNLLRTKAKMYYGRLLKAQIISVDFDDVMGELGVAFTRAVAGYDPNSGYAFTTYLGTCCQNHFNKFANRLMLEHFGVNAVIDWENEAGPNKGLGYISVEDMAVDSDEEEYSDPYGFAECDSAGPESQLGFAQEIAAAINDPSISPKTRIYIGTLVNPALLNDRTRTMLQSEESAIRLEIRERWGVNMRKLDL
jgi:Sigma-70 region 2